MPNSNIPKQVREQGEESDRLMAEANEANKPTLEPVNNDKPNDPANKIDPENYKERFINYKAQTDITIRDLRGDVSQSIGREEVLQQTIADLNQQLQSKPQAPVVDEVDVSKSVQERILASLTEDERENYSPEFIDMLSRVTKVVNSTSIPDTSLEDRIKNIETTQVQTREDKFWQAVDDGVPNWRELQANPDFQKYLNVNDTLLGTTRLNVLKQAQSDLNAERAIAVFKAYANGSQAHIEDEPIPTNPLDKHVVPELTGSGDGGDIQDVPILSAEEISQFYVDVAVGKYKNRPSEMASKEAAIQKIHAALNHSPAPSVENKTEF